MNVSIFTMDKEQAEKKLVAYRQQLKRRANEEYELAAKAYEAAAKGMALLNLADVFRQTGLGEDGRPRLAIARADRPEVEVAVYSRDSLLDFSTLDRSSWGYSGDLLIRVPFSYPDNTKYRKGFALVPMISADVRPSKGQDKDYFILWEVEQWADRSLTSPAPRDPYLLTRIAGDLFGVVAEWDLTDLERSIMQGVRNRRR
jgi:hypothetical protein